MAQRLIHVGADGVRRVVDPDRIDEVHPDRAGAKTWIWLDLTAPTDDELNEVARRFSFDRVTRDDLVEDQFPKLERLEKHWMLVVHALAADAHAVRTVELDIIVGFGWIVTVHAEDLASIDHVFERVQRPNFAADDPRHLGARITEFVGERYLPLLDDLDAQILDLEDGAFVGDPTVLADLQALRRDISLLRRVLGPQRRVLEVLLRSEHGLDERARRDLNDAVDHHDRLVESLDTAHQMVSSVVDTYRGATAEKMNEVMKVLTVFTAIFMPLTLIAGVYGMNFQHMPELDEPWAYGTVLATMVVIAGGLWLYFVRRGFIGGPKISDLARPAKAAGRVGRGLASAAALPLRVTTRVFTSDDTRE